MVEGTLPKLRMLVVGGIFSGLIGLGWFIGVNWLLKVLICLGVADHAPDWPGKFGAGLRAAWIICGLERYYRGRVQRFVRKRLTERGVAICLKCGYDLRGQTEPRCPECGTSFHTSLLKNEFRLGTTDRGGGT